MTPDEITRIFHDHYHRHGHRDAPESSLVPPPGDPVLFTTSGMHPLTPYLLGRPHPGGRRLVDVQRCLRTTDLDEVGDRTHLTVFQMLGSWSLGDYDIATSLRWGYELLTDGYGIPAGRLHATVHAGSDTDGVGPDETARDTWTGLGVPVEALGEDNWWSNGPTGPCGPDSEIFVWTGDGPPTGTPSGDERWVEVWNHVQMRYHRHPDGRLTPLPLVSIDTGMGLERLEMVLRGDRSVFTGDGLRPWVETVRDRWDLRGTDLRVVADHLRCAVVVLGDGVRPSNTGRGYVLRRLLRRALTVLWRDDPERGLDELPTTLHEDTARRFRQRVDPDPLRQALADEERRFRGLLRRGRPLVDRVRARGPLTERDYHWLHDTYGLPRDLVDGLLGEAAG
ncbi:alanine--tRNA ligase-related protein [Micromonospora sp. WMMA1998]|uniref:alanine--tRNA ligase-related protein n=1 Tax=Micromonospora sp. WMMA1998 TaxID=3015167 RepID=UPI00248BCC24|nr:alanine--tRNA ligase-related protein [Micromonospora sp. WMMA1998]WBC15495.1 alanine--tRNA ligase-related protein [Micromonospora sp. WMMA1998]